MVRLEAIDRHPLDATLKGAPQAAIGRPLSDIGTLGLNILQGAAPFPVAVLKTSALAQNSRWMMAFAERAGVSLCPHGKTTMSPHIFDMQLKAGCWGITAACAHHVRTYRHFGVRRVLVANEIVDPGGLDIILGELAADPEFDLYLLVDSRRGLEILVEGVRRRGLRTPVQVLLEVGYVGGRTGVRSLAEALELGRAIHAASPYVSLRGIEAYEGIIAKPTPDEVEQAANALFADVAAVTAHACTERWFAPGEVILTAGGSALFDIAAKRLSGIETKGYTPHVVLRSGCYITHDAAWLKGMEPQIAARSGLEPGFRNALEVISVVLSVPEARRAVCLIGKRDASYDMVMPKPLWWFRPGVHTQPVCVDDGVILTAMNDQHGYVDAQCGAIPWRPGDIVGFGVGHPCTTFDKWRLLLLVDDDYTVTGGVQTFF